MDRILRGCGRKLNRWGLLILSLAGASCATLSGGGGARLEPQRAERIWQGLQDREQKISGMRGLLLINEGKTFGKQGRVVLLAKRPDRLRGDILSEFAVAEQQFLADDRELLLYWPAENEYDVSPPTREGMRDKLSLTLDPAQVVSLLLTTPPLAPFADYRYRTRKKNIILSRNGQRIELGCEGEVCFPVAVEGDDYQVVYSDYANVNGSYFPRHLEVSFHQGKMGLTFLEVELNPVFDKKSFQLELPHDAKLVH